MAGWPARPARHDAHLALSDVARLGPRPRLLLQRRLRADARAQAPQSAGASDAGSLGRGVRRRRRPDQFGDARRQGDLGQGAAAVARAQRLPGRNLPYLFLQPADRRRRQHPGLDVRRHRGNRPRHQRAAAGDAAHAGDGAAACPHPRTARRGGAKRAFDQQVRIPVSCSAVFQRRRRAAGRRRSDGDRGLAVRSGRPGRHDLSDRRSGSAAGCADGGLAGAAERRADHPHCRARTDGGRRAGAGAQSLSPPNRRCRDHRLCRTDRRADRRRRRHGRCARARSRRDAEASRPVRAVAEFHRAAAGAGPPVRPRQSRLSAAGRPARPVGQDGARGASRRSKDRASTNCSTASMPPASLIAATPCR